MKNLKIMLFALLLTAIYSQESEAQTPIPYKDWVVQWSGTTDTITPRFSFYRWTGYLAANENTHQLTFRDPVSGLPSIGSPMNLPVSNATQTALNGKQATLSAGTNITIVGNTISATTSASTYQTATFANSTTATQISTTKESYVQYAYDATVTISLLAGQSVTAILEYADNSGMSTNLVTLDAAVTSNSGVLNLTQTNTLKVSGFVPPAKYRRVRFVTSGTGVSAPSTIKSSQEKF